MRRHLYNVESGRRREGPETRREETKGEKGRSDGGQGVGVDLDDRLLVLETELDRVGSVEDLVHLLHGAT